MKLYLYTRLDNNSTCLKTTIIGDDALKFVTEFMSIKEIGELKENNITSSEEVPYLGKNTIGENEKILFAEDLSTEFNDHECVNFSFMITIDKDSISDDEFSDLKRKLQIVEEGMYRMNSLS